MNREIYKQQLIEEIMEIMVEKEQELQHRKRRLEENILAGVCNKSILAQRKNILMLELELDCLEYELQHNIRPPCKSTFQGSIPLTSSLTLFSTQIHM